MKWRKFMAGTAATVIALSVVAGCGAKKEEPKPAAPAKQETPAPAPAKKVEIEFWGWWASETRMPTINKIVKTWNDKNPNIQVKYVFVPWGELMTKYLASVAAGNPPDVVAIPDIATTGLRGQKKQAMDLSALGADSLKSEYNEQLWNAVTHQGKVYGLPWVMETKYLYYNKDHFKEAGLDPEKGPVSWADLENIANKLDKKEGNKIVRLGFHPLLGNFGYQGWVWNAGGGFFDNRNWPTVNTDKNVEVMNWVKGYMDRSGLEAYAAFRGSFKGGPNHPFVKGQVSTIIETATWEGELKRNGPNVKYGVVPVPTPDGKQHQAATYTGGFSVEIPVGSKNPKEALEFAKYWTGDAALVWATEQNDFPATKKASTINTPEFKRMFENMKYTAYPVRPLTALRYMDAVNKAVEDVTQGKADAKKALGEAQKSVVKMVQESTN